MPRKAHVSLTYNAVISASYVVVIPDDVPDNEAEDWAIDHWSDGEQVFSEEVTSSNTAVDDVQIETSATEEE